VSSQQWPIPPAELRRRKAKSLYEIEMLLREEGHFSFVYDEENDLFASRTVGSRSPALTLM
jgi:hypothetical protein